MLIIPAIDLYQGKVVRLTKGDPSQSTVYSAAPLAIAQKWAGQGAKFLHLVDLSAALGEGDNIKIIRDIIEKIKIKVEVGGGIRDLDKAYKFLSLGAERIVIGTKSLDEGFLNELIKNIDKDKIAVSVDVLKSNLAIEGWRRRVNFKALDYIAYLDLKGVRWIIYTDISRDGTLEGVDFQEIQKLSDFKDMNIIFAGGISSLEDLRRIQKKAPFLRGVIVGKALYESKFMLSEAIAEFSC